MNNFTTVWRGYDKEQVKRYLDKVIEEYEKLLNEKKASDRTRDGCLWFLLWGWTIKGFLYFPPVLEYSLILAIYFSLNFESFFFLDCSAPKLELLVT